MTLIPGTKLDGYEVLGPLGAGGMGEVYRARDSVLKREVAIKVLPSFVSQDSDRLRRFEQEAQATAALNHPNILAVYRFGNFEGAPYLVSELLEGGTLSQQLEHGPLPVRKAIDYGSQIARGLAAAHEKGITHRDLKPDNIFVTKDGRAKILDFGLAKLTQAKAAPEDGPTVTLQERIEPGMVLGTVGYMSPEQVRGKTADHRADIFAFGAILYEMLAGKRAFQKPTSAETMSAILNEDPPALSQIGLSVPPTLQRVVHRCLEKSPEQRFQSASDLAFAVEASSDSGSQVGHIAPVDSGKKWLWIAASGVAILIAAALIAWWRLPLAVPQVQAVTQLTDDGEPKRGRLVTDGSRIYFNEGETGSWRIAQVSVTGGQTGPVSTRLANPRIAALTPDNSALLAMASGSDDHTGPLWLIPLPVGEPRRVGGSEVQDASFFPDGRIVFVQGTALFVAEKNGSNPRKLAQLPRGATAPNVSPDGRRVDFTLCCDGSPSSLQEIAVGSDRLHELPKTDPDAFSCCSGWTPDGRYLLFQNQRNGRWDLWVLPQQAGFLRSNLFRPDQGPVRLTNGPLLYANAVASRDGKQIFAIGAKPRGELVRYDEKIREYIPYLSGISAVDPTFSSDGKWVAYRSYPDSTLWRSRTDGSDRLQLTDVPMVPSYPVMSPDGTRVAFGTYYAVGQGYNLLIVGTEGGPPRKIAEQCGGPTWSPDGNLLALTCTVPGKQAGDQAFAELRIADLQSGTISEVPESQGKCCAYWINQHTLVAATEDNAKFLILDLTTHKWSELASGQFVNWFISPDRTSLYCTTGGPEPLALRIRFSDHKVETIASLKGLRRVVDVNAGTEINVAPDGSALFTRDVGTQEIYALDVKWP
jgi:eukaryotic-like serine/threonine-protein kinase